LSIGLESFLLSPEEIDTQSYLFAKSIVQKLKRLNKQQNPGILSRVFNSVKNYIPRF
jgi:hypothetical protein